MISSFLDVHVVWMGNEWNEEQVAESSHHTTDTFGGFRVRRVLDRDIPLVPNKRMTGAVWVHADTLVRVRLVGTDTRHKEYFTYNLSHDSALQVDLVFISFIVGIGNVPHSYLGHMIFV
jgi:hypothetical protein